MKHRNLSAPLLSSGPVLLALTLLSFLSVRCAQPECANLDVLEAVGFDRSDEAPQDARLVWRGGQGGVSILSGNRDPEVFEPLRDHFGSSTSTVAGRVRWSVLINLDRILLVEHALPLEEGQVIEFDSLLEDVVFTGGGSTPTWWDDQWTWTEGSTTAAPRAMFTEAFATELSSSEVSGAIEVVQLAPVVLRVGLLFELTRGSEAYWGDVEFESQRDQSFCR